MTYKGDKEVVVGWCVMPLEDEGNENHKRSNHNTKREDGTVCVCVCPSRVCVSVSVTCMCECVVSLLGIQ